MFKIALPETLTWPVEVDVPADNGKTTKAKFTAQFKLAGVKQFSELSHDDAALLRFAVTGWDGVDEPFSVEALDRMIDLPNVKRALVAAYLECLNGRRARG